MRSTHAIFSLISIVLISAAANADIISVKYLPSGKSETIAAKDKSSGKPLWTSTVRVGKVRKDGKLYVYREEKGQGIFGGKDRTWLSASYFLLEGARMTPYSVRVTFRDPAGQTVRTLQKSYDAASGKIVCTDNGKTKTFPFRIDTVDKENLSYILANYPVGEKPSVKFDMLTNEPELYNFTIKYLGTDTVALKNGNRSAYKFEMVPDLGAANIFGAFVPKTYFWVSAAVPHLFVKYEGLESGLGTPYIVIENAD